MASVSVIIPSYNCSALLAQAVESVLAQNYPATEILVVDDGSTDNTSSVMQNYGESIRFIAQPHLGRSCARNRGIRLAKGDYIAFLDADDLWVPQKLETQIAALAHHSAVKWAYCRTRLVDEQGIPLQSPFWSDIFGSGHSGVHDVFEDLLIGRIGISTSTIVVDRASLLQVGLFDESLLTAEDTNLWIRLAQQIGPILFTPSVLATRRVSTKISFLQRLVEYDYSRMAPQALLKALETTDKTTMLVKQALCTVFLNSAFIGLLQGNSLEVLQYWQQAVGWADSRLFDTILGKSMAHFALSSARYHYEGALEAQRILRNLIQELRKIGVGKRKISRVAWGELHAAISHMYLDKPSTPESISHARQALWANPYLLSNIGLCKLCLGLTSK
ncbi:MAG: glycosyltransferase [Anaerolineae bacterium]|nr:glycosyltransferase [Anaerolineae bacterium]